MAGIDGTRKNRMDSTYLPCPSESVLHRILLGLVLVMGAGLGTASALDLRYLDPSRSPTQCEGTEPAWSPDDSTLAYLGLFGVDPTRIRGAALRAVTLAGDALPWLQVMTDADLGRVT